MRNLKGFKWISVLGLLVGTASADIVIDNQLIPAADINSISILPSSGQINVSTVGYTVTKDSSTPTDPNAVKIVSFSASPSTIDEGESTTVSWSTQNATSCEVTSALGSLNGITGITGSERIELASAGSYSATLTCQGSSGPVSRVLTVTVRKPVVTNQTVCATPSLSGSTRAWASFWGTAFPAPRYDQETTSIARKGYVALEFETGDLVANGAFVTVGTTRTSGVRLGAISECPGDFKVKSECQRKWGIGGGIGWATDGTANACQLKPDTTYYFNVTFTDGSDSDSSTCTSVTCESLIRHTSR